MKRSIVVALAKTNQNIGNVQTRLGYHAEMTKTGDFNAGMSNFNVSVAQSLSVIADSIIGYDVQSFISDSRIAVDIT